MKRSERSSCLVFGCHIVASFLYSTGEAGVAPGLSLDVTRQSSYERATTCSSSASPPVPGLLSLVCTEQRDGHPSLNRPTTHPTTRCFRDGEVSLRTVARATIRQLRLYKTGNPSNPTPRRPNPSALKAPRLAPNEFNPKPVSLLSAPPVALCLRVSQRGKKQTPWVHCDTARRREEEEKQASGPYSFGLPP